MRRRRSLEERLAARLAGLEPQVHSTFEKSLATLRAGGRITRARVRALLRNERAPLERRTTAAWIVRISGERRFRVALEHAYLRATEPELVWECANALATLEAVGAMLGVLTDRGQPVVRRTAAAYGLGFSHAPVAIAPLIEVLSARDEPEDLRAHAAEALGHHWAHEAFDSLMDTATDPSALVRFWSIFALGNLGDAAAIPLLERLAEQDHAEIEGWWSVAKEARDSIAQIRAFPRGDEAPDCEATDED